MQPLRHMFYQRHPALVAQELIGKSLYRRAREGLCGGTIVEVEAYLFKDDPACHAAKGKTRSNRAMFGAAGRAYVYPIHSRYCFNAVTEKRGVGSAVLIRAIEPTFGVDLMRRRRRRENPLDLTRGPGRLCEALAIDRHLDQWDLSVGQRLWISDDRQQAAPTFAIKMSPRIGISSGRELLLRFFVSGSRFVSGRRAGTLLDTTSRSSFPVKALST
jgi:DNA-3-methyladenine glycosylase